MSWDQGVKRSEFVRSRNRQHAALKTFNLEEVCLCPSEVPDIDAVTQRHGHRVARGGASS